MTAPDLAAPAAYPLRKHTQVMRAHLALQGRRVADVGCGDGSLSRFMAREGAEAIGVEIRLGALDRALKAAGRAGEPAPPRFLCARGEALPFPAASLGAVVYFNSLHHVPMADQPAALDEAVRVLAPGGLLYVLEPLAEGRYHALMRPIEDETEVRARAYEALLRAGAGAALEPLAEECYEAPTRTESFAAWKEGVIAVDPRRRPRVEAQGPDWEAAFLEIAEPIEGGFRLTSPARLNLLRRR